MEQKEEDHEDVKEPTVFDKGSKVEAFMSGGCCCLVFVCSSILWIILFRALMMKNRQIYDLVYDIPTLGIYHNKYDEFFHKYDSNREFVLSTEKILKGSGNNNFQATKDQVSSILGNLDRINEDLAEANDLSRILNESNKEVHSSN